jgi:hypothetical protein
MYYKKSVDELKSKIAPDKAIHKITKDGPWIKREDYVKSLEDIMLNRNSINDYV